MFARHTPSRELHGSSCPREVTVRFAAVFTDKPCDLGLFEPRSEPTAKDFHRGFPHLPFVIPPDAFRVRKEV